MIIKKKRVGRPSLLPQGRSDSGVKKVKSPPSLGLGRLIRRTATSREPKVTAIRVTAGAFLKNVFLRYQEWKAFIFRKWRGKRKVPPGLARFETKYQEKRLTRKRE